MKLSLDLNKILIILGGIGVLAPDLTSASAWLASNHVGWLTHVAHGLGLLAAFCAAAPLVVPRARRGLAFLGLATPPGAKAPWTPGKDGMPPVVVAPRPVDPDSLATPVKPLTTMQIFEAVAASKMTAEQGAALMQGMPRAVPQTEEITKPFTPKKPPFDPTG